MKLNRNKSLSSKRSIASLYSLSAVALGLSQTTTMRMKSAITLGLALSAITLGSLGASPKAYAAVLTNHSGTICKNYNASEATEIDYLPSGTRSYKTSTTYVICPLTRSTTNSDGAYVFVDINHSGTQTTTCTAYSYNRAGALLASSSYSQTGSGHQQIPLPLSGLGKSEAYSDYSVLCSIPGSSAGLIMGVDLAEL